MLNQFRASVTSIWVRILLILLILAFGVWGVGDMVRSGARNTAVATVGERDITSDEFRRAMNVEAENMRRVMGDTFTPQMLQHPIAYGHVIRKIIKQALLQQESEALGLIASDADVVRRIRSNPNFHDNKGNFDKTIFEAMLRNANMSEKTYVDYLRRDMGVTLLVDTLTAIPPVSDTAAMTVLEAREEGRYVTFYSLKPSLVSNVPQPDEAQIKEYYESHGQDFTAPEFRTISYVTITSGSVGAVKVPDEEIKAFYNDHIDNYNRPERRKVEQLLYSSQETAYKARALLKSGRPIEQIARETGALNQGSLSLGMVERHNILENAAEAVFTLPDGGITDPVQSAFGWHIFRVTGIEPPSVAPLEEVRPALEKELKQRKADEALGTMVNQLQDALAGGMPLQEAAREFGLKVTTIGPVNRQGETLDNAKSTEIPDLDNFLEVAFKTDEKTESPLATSKGGVSYIVRVDKTIPERLRALDEVKGLVVSNWQRDERGKRLAALAKEIGDRFAQPADRAAVIAKYNLQAVSTTMIKRNTHVAGDLSLPAPLVADVFARKPQEGTKAYQGRNGDYLLGVLASVVPAGSPEKDPKLAASLAEIKNTLQAAAANEIVDQYTLYLEKKYPVSVHQQVIEAVLK